MNKRWYDRYSKLGAYLDSFKTIEVKYRNPIVKKVLSIIRENDPDLLDKENAADFPLDMYRRRWYDKDPLLWLMFNSLKQAKEELRNKVTGYLCDEIEITKSRMKLN